MKCPVESISKTWSDDERMDVLYSKFRDRSLNSVHYDCKMKFWINAIIDMMREHNELQIQPVAIMERMRRKGKIPHCLDTVIEEMLRSGKLTRKKEFMDTSNVLLKGAVKLIYLPVSWLSYYLTGPSEHNWKMESYVAEELVDEAISKILSHLHSHILNPSYDCTITKEHFVNICIKCGCQSKDIDLIITKLLKDGKARTLSFGEPKIEVVKFVSSDSSYVSPITEIEKSMVLLKDLESRISNDLQHMDNEISNILKEIKSLLLSGQKAAALRHLRRKKNIEKNRAKKESSLFNLQTMIGELEQTGSNKVVLDAFTMGSAALKNLMNTESLTVDKVEDILDNVNETITEQAEISGMLSNLSVVCEDETEIEKELDDLIQRESELNAKDVSERLPSVPSSEPTDKKPRSPVPASAENIDNELKELNKILGDLAL